MGSPEKKKDPEEISDVEKNFEEVIKKMQDRDEVRRIVNECLRQHNLNLRVTDHDDSGTKIINEWKVEHEETKDGILGFVLGDQGKGKQGAVSGEGSDQESLKKHGGDDDHGAQGKGQKVVVSEEREELILDDHVKNDKETSQVVKIVQKLTRKVMSTAESSELHNLNIPASADVSSKKERDDDSNNKSVLGAEGKGKNVVVSGSDSTGDDPSKESIGNLTSTTRSSVDQDISELNNSLKELVGKMTKAVDMRKKLNKRLRQIHLPGGMFIKKEISGDYKKMIDQLKTDHYKTMQQLRSAYRESDETGTSGKDKDVIDSEEKKEEKTTETEVKGKDVIDSKENQELKKQSDDQVKTITESAGSSFDPEHEVSTDDED